MATIKYWNGSAWELAIVGKQGPSGFVAQTDAPTDTSVLWLDTDEPSVSGIPATIINAKGDLIVGSAADTPSILSVAADGSTIVANSAESTGLAWAGNYAAGKNKIINGDFSINQRQFTSTTTSAAYGFDRWTNTMVDGTVTNSTETFTPGTAPVSGYEATNFCRFVTTGQTLATTQARLKQHMEDVRTFAGQTVTVSFWAKASSGTPNVAVSFSQVFGSGGSSTVSNIGALKTSITTSWQRYSFTISVPSISGKTIGSNSYLQFNIWFSAGSNFDAATNTMGIQSNTFDIWGVQAEVGSVATAFQTATGTLQGELAACQRYYFRSGGEAAYQYVSVAGATTTALVLGTFYLPVKMRTNPTLSSSGSWMFYVNQTIKSTTNQPSMDASGTNVIGINLDGMSGLTAGDCGNIRANNDTSAFIAFSAEL